jgi:hypothetical protein
MTNSHSASYSPISTLADNISPTSSRWSDETGGLRFWGKPSCRYDALRIRSLLRLCNYVQKQITRNYHRMVARCNVWIGPVPCKLNATTCAVLTPAETPKVLHRSGLCGVGLRAEGGRRFLVDQNCCNAALSQLVSDHQPARTASDNQNLRCIGGHDESQSRRLSGRFRGSR